MSESVAIIAALPREVRVLVRGWETASPEKNIFVWTKDNAVVACAGMGPERAKLAAMTAMAAMPVTSLLSVGVVGACDPKLRPGDVVRAGLVIDARTGEQFGNSQFRQVLVTVPKIAGVKEKRLLFESYYASAVDMEAATVARIAEARGLYFSAIKTVSDGADFEMEELGQFTSADGQFREAAFTAYAAARPAMWRRLIGLGRNSKRAVDALTGVLESELNWYRQRG
jgi:adenosylhomocysteine nucleosidase